MSRIFMFFLLTCLTQSSFAGQLAGDVNFGLDASPNNHAYKFRLIVNSSAATFSTSCIAPNTGLAQTLSYGAIGQSQVRLTIQASDCAQATEHWITLNGYLDYNSAYWYDVNVNMDDESFNS